MPNAREIKQDPHHLSGNSNPNRCDNSIYAAVYKDAARELGRSEDELATMAWQVFASMLLHVINNRGSVIWTAARQEESGRFSVEVNVLPRFRTPAKTVTTS